MHGVLSEPRGGRGVILQELRQQSFSIMSTLNEERPVGEACPTRVKTVPGDFARATWQIASDF